MRKKFFLFCIACAIFFSSSSHAQLSTVGSEGNPFIKIRDKFVTQYTKKLEAIAVECEENGLNEEAKITRNWLVRRDKDKIYVAILPQKVGESLLDENASEEQKEWEKKFKFENIRIRIGINCGRVFFGNLGEKNRIDYSVFGSAVNLAQRMEINAPKGGIRITGKIWNMIKKDEKNQFPSGREELLKNIKGYKDKEVATIVFTFK